MDKLISMANKDPINPQILRDMMNASTDQEARKIFDEFQKRNSRHF